MQLPDGRLSRLVLRHRRLLDRALLAAGVVSTLALVLVALFLRRGDWPGQRFLIFYVAPLFAYGAAWARDRLARFEHISEPVLAVDALAFVAGALRAAGGWGVLPYSGHMLFLTYAVFSPGTWSLRIVALGLIATTSIFKLLLWHDARTWSLGLVAGLALAAIRACVHLRRTSITT